MQLRTIQTRARRHGWLAGLSAVGVSALLLTGCAVDDGTGPAPSGGTGATGDPITIGLITSTTGSLADAGNSFVNGFEGGLDYLTKGTGIVDGHQIDVQVRNDNGDAATGVAAATELLGNGAKIITGPASSAVAVPVAQAAVQNGATYIAGPSGTTALLGDDPSVFVSGPGGWMANVALVAALAPGTKKILYLGQDYSFGVDSANTIQAAAAKKGVDTERLLLPTGTTDFTAAIAQVKQIDPDVLIVAWPGTGTDQLYGAIADQDLYSSMKVTTGLTYRNAIPGFVQTAGSHASDVVIVSTYYEGFGGGNEMEQAMIAYANKTGVKVDYVHPQGFTAAQMVVQAIQKAGADLDPKAVSAALSGWKFDTPIGPVEIRTQDHLMTTPTWEAEVTQLSDGEWGLKPTKEYSGDELAAALDDAGVLQSFPNG